MTTDLPEGWIAHDGSGCPVPKDSRPAVKFRDGMTINNHLAEASKWLFSHSKQDLWQWSEKHGPADIIAYKTEQTP